MSEINTADAVQVIAWHFIHGAIEREMDRAWELYPEIGQVDWESVEQRVKDLLGTPPTTEEFQVAYDYLEERQKHWHEEHSDA